MRKDSPQYYGTMTRLFHWSMAVMFVFMFTTAIAWNINDELKFLINPHKAAGMLMLALAVFRLLWTISHYRRRPLSSLLAKAGHFALYALMIAVPLLGMLRNVGREQSNAQLVALGDEWHGELGWLLLVLIMGHILMAIYHHIRGEHIFARIIGKETV